MQTGKIQSRAVLYNGANKFTEINLTTKTTSTDVEVVVLEETTNSEGRKMSFKMTLQGAQRLRALLDLHIKTAKT